MKPLFIIVKDAGATLVFSGDTYTAKDTIKSLGRCTWDSPSKTWTVSNVVIGEAALRNLFPQAQFNIESPQLITENAVVESVDKEFEANSSSVSFLLNSVKNTLQSIYSAPIQVYGILSSVKILQSKRVYFELLDSLIPGMSLRAVLWENRARELEKFETFNLEFTDNTPVLIEASITFNLKNGQISLNVEKLVPEYTLGKLQALRDKTNERLKLEKIFTKNKELDLSFLPKNLGILTSQAGTVINDFIASLEVSKFAFNLLWYPIRVQGDYAERDILQGIKYFQNQKNIDAILIFRGGGSATELAIFNSYEVAKSICLSQIPVFSAIGHEYDQSSSQDVSFKSFGVPKDLGRFFSDIIIGYRESLNNFGVHLIYYSKNLIAVSEKDLGVSSYQILRISRQVFDLSLNRIKLNSIKLRSLATKSLEQQNNLLVTITSSLLVRLRSDFNLKTNLVKTKISSYITANKFFLTKKENLLVNEVRSYISFNEKKINDRILRLKHFKELPRRFKDQFSIVITKIEHFEELLKSFSPEVQLARGYAIIKNSDRKEIITSINEIIHKNSLLIEMRDGEVELNYNVKKGKEDEK